MRHVITRILIPALLVAGIAMLAACETIDAQSIQYAGAPHPPPGDPARVQILRNVPPVPHDRLGEVTIDASVDPSPPISEIEARMRQEAAKLGADAVVVVLDRVQPTAVYVSGPWWGRSADTVVGRKLVGVAIKYR